MLAGLLQILLQKLLRRIPRLVRIECFHVQEERTLLVILLEPVDRVLGSLLHNRFAVLQPALAVGGVLIEEIAEALLRLASELARQFGLVQVVGGVRDPRKSGCLRGA